MDVEAIKDGQRFLWSAGDFPEIATMLEPASEAIAKSLQIGPGDRVLDVATGTGNLAIPAAALGADVVGLDLTPKLLEAARERAAREGVDVDWIEGDAEDLPFDDDSFDHVTSCFGMIFAPQHDVAAAEMVRVCRPGGKFAITSWARDGMNGTLFDVMQSHMPVAAPDMPKPTDWGDEQYIRDRFAGSGADLKITRETCDFRADSLEEWVTHNEAKLSPMVVFKSALEPQGKWEALRADLIKHYESYNTATDGSWIGPADYLLAVGRLPA